MAISPVIRNPISGKRWLRLFPFISALVLVACTDVNVVNQSGTDVKVSVREPGFTTASLRTITAGESETFWSEYGGFYSVAVVEFDQSDLSELNSIKADLNDCVWNYDIGCGDPMELLHRVLLVDSKIDDMLKPKASYSGQVQNYGSAECAVSKGNGGAWQVGCTEKAPATSEDSSE